MSKVAKTVAIGVVIAGALGFGIYKYFNRDQFDDPGQSWKNDTLFSWEVVRLLDTGKYVSRVWCDVCPVRLVSGVWSKSDNVVVLRPNDGRERTKELLEIESNGCRLLAPRVAIEQS